MFRSPLAETQSASYVNVVGVALADAALGLRQAVFVLGTLHDGDGKGRHGEQEGVNLKAFLLGEGSEAGIPRPAGRCVVDGLEEKAPGLSPEEDAGIDAALESYIQGRVVDAKRAREIIDAVLGR